MPLDFGAMLLTAEARLAQARDAADACRDRGELYRLLMRNLFLMEDIVFMLHEITGMTRATERERAR